MSNSDLGINNTAKYNTLVTIFALITSILAFLAFSIVDGLVKVLVQWYSPLFISTYSRIGSTCILLFILIGQTIFNNKNSKTTKQKSPFKIYHLHSHILRGVLLVIISITFTYGFSILPLNTGYSIIFLLPMITAMYGAIFLKEYISKIGLLAILGGFIGVLLVLRPGIITFSHMYFLGYLSLFIGILTEAPFFILIRHYHKTDNPFNVIFYPSVLATIALIVIMQMSDVSFEIYQLSHGLLLLASAVLYVLAQICLVFSLSKITAHTSIAMQYTQIIWGSLFGVFWFKDTYFDLFYVIGTIIIILCSYTVASGKILFLKKKII